MPYNYLLHHSESVDPELIEAIIHKIMSATGFSSFTMTWPPLSTVGLIRPLNITVDALFSNSAPGGEARIMW